MSERAYSHIDRGAATAGNRWFDRAWQLFNGQTFSLELKERPWDWATAASEEVAFTLNGERTRGLALPDIEIAEHANPFGAGITIIRTSPDIRITTDTTALHDHPAYVRRHRIMNSTDTELTLENYTLDALTLGHEEAVAAMGDYSAPQRSLLYRGEALAVGVHCGGQSLLMGVQAPAIYDVFESNNSEFAIRLADPVQVPPHAQIDLPIAYGILWGGPMAEASQRVLGDVRLSVHDMTKPREELDG